MIASGLTLRHYPSFDICTESLPAYKTVVGDRCAELDEFGIHVMVSQGRAGHLVLGDSHQYGDDATLFRHERIDELIMEELARIVDLNALPIDQRWHGCYLKCMNGDALLFAEPDPGIWIVNGLGGNGMTLSLGVADQMWKDPDCPKVPLR